MIPTKKEFNQISKTIADRVFKMLNFFKNTILQLKKPSQKTFWKVGLFLVFAGVMMISGFQYTNKNESNSSFFIKVNVAHADWEQVKNWLLFGDSDRTWEEAKSGIAQGVKDSSFDFKNMFYSAIKQVLWGVLQVVHWLVLISAKIFDSVIDRKFFDEVVRNNHSIYIAWAMVRDFLNLFFMLTLLFSAFSTIFQVEKYHLKKIIILLVVMALLVNFSYPITLFVIDFSNSAMYFLTNLIPHSTVNPSQSALIAKMSDMGMLTKAIMEKADISALILSIIFQFILFVTLFAFAINLLIRILAFAILLVFAPAGFALSFFPSTSNISGSWWDNLIKYAVMGPLMIFFLLLAGLMFNATGGQQFDLPTRVNDVGFVVSSLLFTVPIVFLWMGLIASQKFGGEASSTAMGVAKQTGNWVKRNGSRMAYRGVDVASGHRISGGIGAIKRRWDRWDENYASKSAARSSKYAEKLGVTGAEEQNMINQANEYNKKGLSTDALKAMSIAGDPAAAYLLAERNKMDLGAYNQFTEKYKGSQKVKDAIRAKIKLKRVDLAALNKAQEIISDSKKLAKFREENNAENWNNFQIKKHIVMEDLGSLEAEQFAQQDWININKHLRNLESDEKTIIQSAVKEIYNEKMTDESRKKVKGSLMANNAGVLRDKFNLPV